MPEEITSQTASGSVQGDMNQSHGSGRASNDCRRRRGRVKVDTVAEVVILLGKKESAHIEFIVRHLGRNTCLRLVSDIIVRADKEECNP